MKDVHWEPFVQQNIPFSPVHIFHRREPPMFGIGNVMESVQYQERIIQPHLKVTVSEMRTLHRQRIDISLVDSTGRIVVDAITKSKKKLIVGSDFLIFPNLRLQKRSYICERKAPESDDNFRVRIDAAGQTLYTNSFTVAKKRKVNLDESNKRNVKHKK